jgi:flagellar M-ring protein FliF
VDAATDHRGTARGQLLIFGGIFAVVIAILALGYFLFVRADYVVLAQGMRPADASAIVAELDKGGKAYRLSDGGTTILVPAGEADATRVAIAGSDVAARGQIGFELFNKSDMGLTNFAQKINYQRALQGELVRTISQMDGVESARVHLALPERALFRGDRVEPKAAVTVTMKPTQIADAARVAGIQQLVAAAVPDLPEAKVIVLDSGGRVISARPAENTDRPADMEERQAAEGYYRARARGEIERQMPGMRFALKMLLMPAPTRGAPTAAESGWIPSGEGAARNFRARVIFVSQTALNPDDQGVVRNAVTSATGFNTELGDTLWFEVGPVDAAPAPIPTPVTLQAPIAAPTAAPVVERLEWPPIWIWLLPAMLIVALVVWRFRSPSARLSDDEQEAFAQRLRRQLNLSDEARDAAA